MRKHVFGVSTWYNTNQAVQLKKIARIRYLKFWIYEVEELYYLCGENKGCAIKRFSQGVAHFMLTVLYNILCFGSHCK